MQIESPNALDESAKRQSNLTWVSDSGFRFGAKFFGKDTHIDESGRIEIDLRDSSANCIHRSHCFAECRNNEVKKVIAKIHGLRLFSVGLKIVMCLFWFPSYFKKKVA